MTLLSLISPAKKMAFEAARPDLPLSRPQFGSDARALIKVARGWSADDIAAKMKLSDNLAQLNHERYQAFKMRGDDGDQQATLLAFQGDVYKGRTAMLPTTLRDARAALLKSKMLRTAFGADVVQHYARAAEWEIEEFDRIVTDYEVARGFERA